MVTHVRMIIFLFAAVLGLSVTQVQAQQSRRGNELDLLRNGDVVRELGLTPAQEEKLAEVAKGANPGKEVFDPFLQRLKDAPTEEHTKIREEMQAAIAKAKEDAGLKALTILDSRQLKLLRAMYLTRAGARALADPRIAADLTLTEEQKKQIDDLAKQSSEASAKLSSETSEEDRAQFWKEWDGKALAVLTADQRKIWDGQIAAVPAVAAQNSDPSVASTSASAPAMLPDGTPPAGAEIVSSFGASSDSSDGTKLVEKFSFNFRYAPWDQVLQDFAIGAGYTLDLNQVPPGTFSHLDNKEYTAGQALDILNGYLQRKGYALIVKDGFLVCLNVDKGLLQTLIPDVTVDDLLKVENGIHTIGNNQIVRIEIPLERLDVGVMAQEVEALLGPLGTMTAFTQTGSLIIADTGANLRRIKSYVDASIARRKGDQVFKSYPLKNIDVEEAEFMLLSQFGMRQGVTNVSSSGGGDRRGGAPTPTTATQTQLQVLADARTNSLYVTGTPDQQVLVDEILKVIDGATGPDGQPLTRTGNTGPYLKVYKVAGQADQVALSINSMMPGVVVNESGRDGTIHIYGTEKQQQQVETWIKEFAQATGAGGSVAVIPLFKMDPLSAAATLRNLFIAEGTAAPTIETDLYGNRIIVKGTAVQVDQIKQVLKDLGEDGVKKQSEGGTIRRYSLRGRDPQEFFNYLEREWQSNEKTPIRIVVPRNSGPIRDLKTPSGSLESKPESEPQRDSEPTTRIDRKSGLRMESGYFPTSTQQESNAAVQESSPIVPAPVVGQQQPGDEKPTEHIQIVVDGDELLLLSNDEEALDRLEETMDFLQQSIPFRTKWTVFYLQAADATEAAALLEQFIPSSSVSNTASTSSFGLSSMFNPITESVSNMTGLSSLGSNPQVLRIIPDTRSNSLFVTGPQSLVEECQSFLEVLDSNNIPESLRNLQPRRIEVKYAEIEDIANIVTESFKPYMEPPGGRQQQNNPFAQMFGGSGGGKSGGNEPQGVQLTVATDKQSSSLIVSSSEALYLRVKGLVEELDETARKQNRTIRVVQLKNSDPTLITNSLTSLFPRVTTSSTRPSSSSTNSSNSNNSNGNNSGSGSSGRDSNQSQQPTDPFQQMMQDRMRQRGSSGGASPFGSGGFSPFGGGGTGRGGFSPFGGGNFGGGGRGGR